MRPEVLVLLGELLDDREILLRRLEQAAAVDLSAGDDADFALVALSLHHAYAAMESMLTRMKFRHFLHDYGAELDAAQLVHLQGHARALQSSLSADFSTFETWLRAVAEQ